MHAPRDRRRLTVGQTGLTDVTQAPAGCPGQPKNMPHAWRLCRQAPCAAGSHGGIPSCPWCEGVRRRRQLRLAGRALHAQTQCNPGSPSSSWPCFISDPASNLYFWDSGPGHESSTAGVAKLPRCMCECCWTPHSAPPAPPRRCRLPSAPVDTRCWARVGRKGAQGRVFIGAQQPSRRGATRSPALRRWRCIHSSPPTPLDPPHHGHHAS